MTEPVPAPITYRFERDDCWRLGRMLFRPSMRSRLLRILAMTACLFGGLMLGLGHWPTRKEWDAVLETPHLLALFAVFLLLAPFSHYFNVVTLWARFRNLAIAEKSITLTFRQDGLDAEAAGTHSSIPWANFITRTEEGDRVFLRIGKWEALTIPRRAFPDDASWQGACAFLREKVPHAG